ncbi:MAG: hypothetical protein JXD23_06885 [Spirochaetales bacterium]|nr:hypothetical protein [Spirochaetales bacterium]
MIRCLYRLFYLSAILVIGLLASCTASKIASGDFAEIQARVDALEKKAIEKKEFSQDDKAFLKDLYSSLAFGGRFIGHNEAADMLERYLAGTGESLRLGSGAYEANAKVKAAMEKLKSRIRADAARGKVRDKYSSDRITVTVSEDARLFYFSNVFFVMAIPEKTADGRYRIRFRVDLTARFISYAEEKARYGKYGRVRTPFVKNDKGEVFTLDDGLSQYLTVIGLAKVFDYYSEWTVNL